MSGTPKEPRSRSPQRGLTRCAPLLLAVAACLAACQPTPSRSAGDDYAALGQSGSQKETFSCAFAYRGAGGDVCVVFTSAPLTPEQQKDVAASRSAACLVKEGRPFLELTLALGQEAKAMGPQALRHYCVGFGGFTRGGAPSDEPVRVIQMVARRSADIGVLALSGEIRDGAVLSGEIRHGTTDSRGVRLSWHFRFATLLAAR